MGKDKFCFDRPTTALMKAGKLVGITDREYDVNGHAVLFDEVEVRGDLAGELDYNGRRVRIVRVDEIIGLSITPHGARGPLWKGVECEVIDREQGPAMDAPLVREDSH